MKKIFTIIFTIFGVIQASQADILSDNNLEYANLGTAITDVNSLTDGYYALQSNSQYYLYQNQTDGKIYQTNSTSNLGKINVVKIAVTNSTNNSKTVTIQAINSSYYKGTPGQQIETDEDVNNATQFTVTLQSNGVFFLKNSDDYPMNGNTSNYATTQIANNKKWLGGWSQFKIYPANTQTRAQKEFHVYAYYAPEGTTYSIHNESLTLSDEDNDGISTGTFSDFSDNINNTYITVTTPDGYSAFASVSGTTYTINFAPTVIGTTKYYYTNKPASDIQTGQWYLISQTRDGLGFVNNNNGTYYKYATSNFPNGSTITTNNYTYLFQFLPSGKDGEYYIMGADGKFFGKLTGNDPITASNTREAYSIKKIETSNGTSTYYFSIQNANSSVVVDNNGNNNSVAGWNKTLPTTESSNAAWRFFPVSDTQTTFNVSWNISYVDGADTKITTITQSVIDGEDATLPSLPFTTITTNDTYTNITENKEISATATFNTPFTASTDYATATWYYVRNGNYNTTSGNTNDYLYYSETDENKVPASNEVTNTAAYKWAFIGNPIDGYQVINKAAGASKYVYATSSSQNPIISTTEQADGGWKIYEGTTINNHKCFAFTFQSNSSEQANQYWNWQQHQIKYWQLKNGNGNYDNGSNWYAIEAPDYDMDIAMHALGENTYATTCLPVAFNVPDGITAYKVTAAQNNDSEKGTATLTAIEGTVPAEEPVVLIGTDANQTKITLTAVTDNTTEKSNDNKLRGILTATAPNSNDYYFGKLGDAAGFYRTNVSTVKAISYKAYLPSDFAGANAASKGYAFSFGDDDVTGINSATETVTTADENATRYNLQGQRVGKDAKGIIIIGGKKYIIK